MTLDRQEYAVKIVLIRRIINERWLMWLSARFLSGIGQLEATLTKRQTRMMELAKAVALVGISGLQWDARNPIFWEGELF